MNRLLKTLNEWFGTQSAMIKIMEFKKSEKFWISIKNMVKFLNQTDILNINAKSPLLQKGGLFSYNVIYLTKRTNHVNIIVVKELRRLSGGIYNVGFTENQVE